MEENKKGRVVTVKVTDPTVAKGHNITKKVLEMDREQNKGVSRKVTNNTVAKRLILAGMEVK